MKPIIFNSEMVMAILAGDKTQTRRVIKPQPIEIKPNCFKYKDNKYLIWEKDFNLLAPYEIGQTIWVRETFGYLNGTIIYRAGPHKKGIIGYAGLKWKSSIFMPRKVARIFLKIINIRIERIQDVKRKDVFKEGIQIYNKGYYTYEVPCYYKNLEGKIIKKMLVNNSKDVFINLWDSINKKRGYGWDENPYIWVYDFEIINGGEKQCFQ